MRITTEDLRQRLVPILLAQAFGLVCGVIGVRLTSRWVDPADYGNYGIFASLASIGVSVVYAGLVRFVSRHWRETVERPAFVREILEATLRKAPWLLAACAGAALVAAPQKKILFGLLLFLSALLLAFTQLIQSALQAAREHWRDLGINGGVSVTRSFMPPLFYRFTGAGLSALLAGFVVQAAAGAVIGAWAMRRWWQPAGDAPARRILTPVYDGPRFVILAAAGWILAGLNRWLVAWRFGTEMAGYFTLAGNIGMILPTMVGMVILQYFQPQWFAIGTDEAACRQLLRQVDRAAAIYTVLAVGLTVALQMGMPLLVGPLINERYLPASSFVLMTGLATTTLIVGVYYHSLLLAAKRERACTAADLSGAACLIAGSVAGACLGLAWFKGWLVLSPVVPWLINRTLAKRALLARV
jgi:hypothetical protein